MKVLVYFAILISLVRCGCSQAEEANLFVVLKTVYPSTIHSVAFSPDGKRIVFASHDGTVQIWNLEMLLKLPPRPAVSDF